MAKGRKTGGGPRTGSPNKSTATAREAIARFVEEASPRFLRWLDEIERTKGPEAAFRCAADLIEYHVPKLSRAEVTGADGGPQIVRYEWGEPT